MGCANTKAGAAGATAYGAPEDAPDAGDPTQTGKVDVPKVVVDGEATQSGEMAVNGSVVQNGHGDSSVEETGACNGDVNGSAKDNEGKLEAGDDVAGKSGLNAEDVELSAPSVDEKSNDTLNGGEGGSDEAAADGASQNDGEKTESKDDEGDGGKDVEENEAKEDAGDCPTESADCIPADSGYETLESRESNQDGSEEKVE